MQLTQTQIEHFDSYGYLFFPSLFTPEEIRVLIDEVPYLYTQHRPENVREKGSDAVRTNFAAHMYSKPFAKLARYPRMVTPVMQIFGEPVYMHQFKINGKMAFGGDLWPWHQDYGTWKNDDLMPEARAMNVAIFLDEVNEFNSLCAVSNHIRRCKQPAYIAHRDFTPIACLPDDCLLRDYDVPLPWQDGTPEAALQPTLATSPGR